MTSRTTAPGHDTTTPGARRAVPRRTRPKAALWSCLGLAAVLAASGSLLAVAHREDASTASEQLDSRLLPTRRLLNDFVVTVHLGEAAHRDHRITGEPVLLRHRTVQAEQARRLAGTLVRLNEGTALAARAARLAEETDRWRGAAPASGADRVLDEARLLSGDLRRDSDRAHSEAAVGRDRILLGLSACAAALFVLLGSVLTLVWRRMLVPLGELERYLHRSASDGGGGSNGGNSGGEQLHRTPRRHTGWIADAWLGAEGVRQRQRESDRAVRRVREALERDAVTSLGLRQILVSTERPGPGVRAHGDIVAAEGLIAGDWLGVLPLPGGATAVFLGDVSGHGIEAGLLAVRLKTVVEVGLRLGRDLDSTVRAAWQALSGEDERFSTLALAVLDPASSTLSWVNAGHEEPFLLRADGTVERLAATGPLIHPLLEPAPGTWETATTELRPGDLLALCTDGLTEGRRADGEEFGEARVAALLTDLPVHGREPVAVTRALHRAAESFGVDWERDDISLLIATRATTPTARTA
ncbi:PP2C family protein-serine/threonine phosphatase [Kitasatospora sp. NPDC051853]|uniref:PP2C family protein-serine/threonine phosphatase n=1 Tax=Kitasatospora sp. NPDC051853 TaxID=3364058 RepID=UPI00379C95C6